MQNIMKKIVYILFIVVFSLYSCQNDDSVKPTPTESNNPKTLLIGKWNMIKKEIHQNGKLTSSTDLKNAECDYNYFNLKDNSTKDEIYHDPENNCKIDNYDGNWVYDDSEKKISLTSNNSEKELIAEIISLSKSNLKIKIIREDNSSPPVGFEVYLYLEK